MNNSEKNAQELWQAKQDRKKAIQMAEVLKDHADFYLEVINPEGYILGMAAQNLLRTAEGNLSSLNASDVKNLYRDLVVKIMEELRKPAND